MAARPAHRPSRRASVIHAAVHLFAVRPADAVTVADIAAAADMTAAAVYYHFPSKEDILLEGLEAFTGAYLGVLRRWLVPPPADTWAGLLVVDMLAWCDDHRDAATVYFARSAGLDLAIEALRRATRIEQVKLLARALEGPAPGARAARAARAEVGVMALAVVSTLETAAAAWLTQDAVFTGLGRDGFLDATAALADRIVARGDG